MTLKTKLLEVAIAQQESVLSRVPLPSSMIRNTHNHKSYQVKKLINASFGRRIEEDLISVSLHTYLNT